MAACVAGCDLPVERAKADDHCIDDADIKACGGLIHYFESAFDRAGPEPGINGREPHPSDLRAFQSSVKIRNFR